MQSLHPGLMRTELQRNMPAPAKLAMVRALCVLFPTLLTTISRVLYLSQLYMAHTLSCMLGFRPN